MSPEGHIEDAGPWAPHPVEPRNQQGTKKHLTLMQGTQFENAGVSIRGRVSLIPNDPQTNSISHKEHHFKKQFLGILKSEFSPRLSTPAPQHRSPNTLRWQR